MRQTLLAIAFACFTSLLIGQSNHFDEPIFKISVFTHSIGKPFGDFVKTPLNFGISLGLQFAYNKDKQNPLAQEFEISWFKHRYLNKALMVRTNISKNYFSDSGFFIAPEIGIGYIMDISENASYSLNEAGTYARDAGISHGFVTHLAFSAGKQIDKEGRRSFTPFIKYEGMIQLPYSDFTPLLPHTMFHLGSKIFLTDNN